MGKSFPPAKHPASRTPSSPTFGDRLRFVVWLAALNLGVESGQELAAAMGTAKNQVSKWLNEKPRPSWDSIKLIAKTVGIDAAWLDDPALPGAQEPTLWGEWWEKRQEYQGRSRRGA